MYKESTVYLKIPGVTFAILADGSIEKKDELEKLGPSTDADRCLYLVVRGDVYAIWPYGCTTDPAGVVGLHRVKKVDIYRRNFVGFDSSPVVPLWARK